MSEPVAHPPPGAKNTELNETVQDVARAEKPATEAKKSKGNFGAGVFDWGVYLAAMVGTFVATLPITYSAYYGKCAKGIERATQWTQKSGVSEGFAKKFWLTNVLGLAGHLSIFPIKFLEDRKEPIVNWINRKTGCSEVAYKDDVKQTWSSLIKGRIAAWSAVFVSLHAAEWAVGKDTFTNFQDKFAEKVCTILKKPVDVASKPYKYGHISSLDVFATVAATALLYVGSRFFAVKNKKRGEEEVVSIPEIRLFEREQTHGSTPTINEATPSCHTHFRDQVPHKENFEARVAEKATMEMGQAV